MTYETSVSFSGNRADAMRLAIDALSSAGMRITSRSEAGLSFIGPGMVNSGQNPLVGVSAAEMTLTGNTILISAELGGIRKLIVFLCVLVVSIEIVTGAVVGVALHGRMRLAGILLIAFWPVALWVVLIPVLAVWMKRRTIRSIDTLLHNMAMVAGSAA